MRRLVPAAVLLLTGCSNAPLAGLMDCVSPARGGPGAGPPPGPVVPDTRPPVPRNELPPPAGDFLPPVGPRP